MKAYSQDVRQRVLRAIDQGKSQAEVAETFVISTSSIKRYLKIRRESGHVLPKAIPGRPNVEGAALRTDLLEQIESPSRCDARAPLSNVGSLARVLSTW